MKFSWKILSLAAMFVVGLAILVPSGAIKPTAVSAASCNNTTTGGTLVINVTGTSGFSGFGLQISPTPLDDGGTTNNAYSSAITGSATIPNACATTGGRSGGYVVQITRSGVALANCQFNTAATGSGSPVGNDELSGVTVAAGGTTTLTFTATCGTTPTPTVTATATTTPGTATATATTTGTVLPTATSTSTVGTATQAVLTATSTSLGCSSSTFVTALIKDANGAAVPGAAVSFTATRGTVTSTVTTDGAGNALAVFTAPATGNTPATVTATGSSFTGTTSITINCNAGVVPPTAAPAAPAAPPVTTAPSQVTPPRTGDAGLADTNRWQTYVGFALIAGSMLGSFAVVRNRS